MKIQNLWHAAKAVLRGKFITIQSQPKKQGKLLADNLTLHLKQLKKEKQTNNNNNKNTEGTMKTMSHMVDINPIILIIT